MTPGGTNGFDEPTTMQFDEKSRRRFLRSFNDAKKKRAARAAVKREQADKDQRLEERKERKAEVQRRIGELEAAVPGTAAASQSFKTRKVKSRKYVMSYKGDFYGNSRVHVDIVVTDALPGANP